MEKSADIQSKEEVNCADRLLSVVVSAYNEEEVLPEFHKRISSVLKSMTIDAEIVYVNDGSTDKTLEVMQHILESDPRVAIVDLSRNFGKETAMIAGLDHAKGGRLITFF